jgi:hypothetical protein
MGMIGLSGMGMIGLSGMGMIEHSTLEYYVAVIPSNLYPTFKRNTNLHLMKLNNFSCLTILVAVLATVNVAPAFASDSHQSKYHVTKSQAGQIALSKVRGGTMRTAELETANGSRFWSVYVVKSGSENAKEVRVDATTGKILSVQTEKPEDQAEEPAR